MPTGNKKKGTKKKTGKVTNTPADLAQHQLNAKNGKWKELADKSPRFFHRETCEASDFALVDEIFWTVAKQSGEVKNKKAPDILEPEYEMLFKGPEYGGGGEYRCDQITTEVRGFNKQRLTPGSDDGWDQHLIRAQLLAARVHRNWVEDLQTGPRVGPGGRGPGPGGRGPGPGLRGGGD